MGNVAHLVPTQWPKGKSPNPGGRPKNPKPIQLKDFIYERTDSLRTVAKHVIETLENRGADFPGREFAAWKFAVNFLMDRTLGKAANQLNVDVTERKSLDVMLSASWRNGVMIEPEPAIDVPSDNAR